DARVLALDGTLRELEGDIAGAVEAFAKAAAANPEDLASRWAAARLSGKSPDGAPRAIREIETALEHAPSNVFLLARLCEARRGEGNRAAALSACDRLGRAIESGGVPDPKLEKYSAEAPPAAEGGGGGGAGV